MPTRPVRSCHLAAQAYKGFGLGFMMDILAGGLSGGDCSRPDRPMPAVGNSVVFLLWNVDAFGGREHFLIACSGLTEFVRGTPCAPGVDRITLPGDPERETRARREVAGIPIPEGTWVQIVQAARELGVDPPANG